LALGIVFGCSSNDDTADPMTPLRVDRASCEQAFGFYPEVLAGAEADSMPAPSSPVNSPFCSCTVGWADEVPLVALLSLGGMETPVAGPVQWSVSDPSVAVISPDGVVTFLVPGDVEVWACLEDVCSEPYPLTGLENPQVVSLEIFPDYFYPMPLFEDIGMPAPGCLGCMFEASLRILAGDTANFFARGILETGSWVDLTTEVGWLSSEPAAATLDADGLLTAHAKGETDVSATYESLTSNTVAVEVLDEAVLQDLFIYKQSGNGVLKVGSIDQLHADAYYDPWMVRDVTAEVTWIVSDPAVAAVGPEGILTALAPGFFTVKAFYQGKVSMEIGLEIWDEIEMSYCDPAAPNRAFWSDEYNRVILESDCASYPAGGQVSVRYTIEENQPHEWGILDPCLDLVVLDAAGEIVKTLRFEGCGDLPFALEAGAQADFDPIYQYSAVWDRTSDSGAPVAPGAYTIAGRFYIYYDPVVRLGITLVP
jgi:hypothetical protein